MSSETSNVLIAYFSRTGHTRVIAEKIESNTGGDLFEIVTVNAYPADYEDCVDVARVEYETNARPELATHVSNMDDYDVVFLGYPDWFGT
ncbi:MAG: flavodoxin, partial [Bacillus sp. (in: firmicutes)]